MFTGLIETTGTVAAFASTANATRLTITTPLAARLHEGDSIAVNGVCLTALAIQKDKFSADLAAETIARTTLGRLAPGTLVNLELPTPAGTPLGGHIVQGHVDGVGALLALDPPRCRPRRHRLAAEAPHPRRTRALRRPAGIDLRRRHQPHRRRHPERRGRDRHPPHTRAVTNLHTLAAGSPLNIEVDMLAKYAEKQFIERHKNAGITLDEFIAKGF